MGWIDELHEHGTKAKARKQKPVAVPVRNGPPPVVQEFCITVRGASETDPGQIDVGFYILENGQVTLTDADGKELQDAKPEAVPNGIDPKSMAILMLRKRRQESNAGFNRPLPGRAGGWR